MQAIQIRNAGGPEVLELVDIAQPQPAPGEVLVRAVAIGVGKPDVLMRTGVYRWMPALPATPGTEMTGTIAALGDGVAARFPELRNVTFRASRALSAPRTLFASRAGPGLQCAAREYLNIRRRWDGRARPP